MTIKTKYNIGDEVWTEYYTIPAKMIIVSISFKKKCRNGGNKISISQPC